MQYREYHNAAYWEEERKSRAKDSLYRNIALIILLDILPLAMLAAAILDA